MPANQPKQNRRLIVCAVAFVVAFMASSFFINYTFILDWLSNLSYTHPQPVAELADNLELTDRAASIFLATKPSLESQQSFNQYCNSHNTEISILGCFSNNHIYLYNIDTSSPSAASLSGVVESTAAHELLHAVWARLSLFEKLSLTQPLEEVYNSSQQLQSELALYNEDERIEELHSRVGTQIADLPASLEAHYAKYFKNQDTIVSFYDSYNETFRLLSEEINQLRLEMDALEPDIQALEKEYLTRAKTLKTDAEQFNQQAESGQMTSDDFYARRAELVAEDQAVTELYNQLSTKITEFNQKANQFNSNILRTDTLEKTINSNAQKPLSN